MRHYLYLILPCLVALASCSKLPFDPAIADAEIPDLLLNADKEATVLAEGRLYWHGRPFSGWLLSYHPDGNPARKEGFLKGRKHGTSQSWYPNGQIRERRTYCHGQKEGRHEGWWENGKVRYQRAFSGGLQHGRSRDWNENGMLFRDFNYEKGRESGPQKMWKADGAIQANYEVRDGRRYGYIGTKNCVSVSQDPLKNIGDASN